MHKKIEVNRTKIKGDCQSRRKAAHQQPSVDLTLATLSEHMHKKFEVNWIKILKGWLSIGKKSVTIEFLQKNASKYLLKSKKTNKCKIKFVRIFLYTTVEHRVISF